MENTQDRQESLDWLAFRYVANELSGLERVAFEGQLASDQKAREAVARMVRQTAVLSQALASPADGPTVAASQTVWKANAGRWLAIGIASSLALFAAVLASRYATLPAVDGRPISQVAVSDVESADLAYVWAEVRGPRDDFADALFELPAFNDLLLSEADLVDEADHSLSSPSWMIAAVAGMDQRRHDDMGLQE